MRIASVAVGAVGSLTDDELSGFVVFTHEMTPGTFILFKIAHRELTTNMQIQQFGCLRGHVAVSRAQRSARCREPEAKPVERHQVFTETWHSGELLMVVGNTASVLYSSTR